ncbi:substrate-binding periplasmic protein [Inhella gelatinilytica]|uniref:Transporter substrate-binding domain-containing protein n=1 Tax=Inhella gelatinilytica TaxID=2795030 RepID=A0A931NE08_9BURK|nr:transporter substrate-binding domain-containing protein [Inhella gelatinilytica]MBH9552006.1 transporter substrate-binding domain-containing protein [Inhella gelatinilytica]
MVPFWIRWSAALALTFGAVPAVLAARVPAGQEVRVCDDANEWPPYTEAQRRNGQITGEVGGRSVVLLQRLAALYGWRLQIKLLPWNRCLALVRSGEHFHMLLNALPTPERERNFLFSDVVHEIHTDVLWSRRVHPQGLKLKRAEDLRPYRMGGNLGYTYPTLQRLNIPLSAEAPHPGSLVQMMHRNRIDAVLVAREVMPTLRDLEGRPLRDDPDLGQAPMPEAEVSRFRMMFTRATPLGAALQADVNAGLARLRASGDLSRILGGG